MTPIKKRGNLYYIDLYAPNGSRIRRSLHLEDENTANGNRVKEIRDIAGRFIRDGLPAPRQMILNKGKDLNEFYQLMKKG
jgi:hypothetical protein